METKTSAKAIKRAYSMAQDVDLPPLESGDRLTRQEFERRYSARPDLKKTELIEGVVYVPSPVRITHGRPHGQIMAWLGAYCAATPGVDMADNTTLRLDLDNEPQPDALLRLEPEAGGRSRIDEDDYIEGAPELIIEVAASSAAYDLHDKQHAYRRNAVQEYLVWQVYEQQIDWWELSEGEYVPLEPDRDNIIWSRVFPGLCLHVPGLLEGRLADVLAALRKGLETEEHATFVKRLAASKQ